MPGLNRSPSVQSFASNESISTPESTTREHPTMSSSLTSSGAEIASNRFHLPDGNIKFKLDDDTMYNVHRYFFSDAYSPKFAAEFLCNKHAEVVRLPGVTSVDLDCFLSLIYPSAIGERQIHTVEEWASVLRLATLWSFDRLRELAIRKIEPIAGAVDKIVIAREFGFGDSWLTPAFEALRNAPRWLEYEEAERLGLRTVVDIGRAREELRARQCTPPDEPPHRDMASMKAGDAQSAVGSALSDVGAAPSNGDGLSVTGSAWDARTPSEAPAPFSWGEQSQTYAQSNVGAQSNAGGGSSFAGLGFAAGVASSAVGGKSVAPSNVGGRSAAPSKVAPSPSPAGIPLWPPSVVGAKSVGRIPSPSPLSVGRHPSAAGVPLPPSAMNVRPAAGARSAIRDARPDYHCDDDDDDSDSLGPNDSASIVPPRIAPLPSQSRARRNIWERFGNALGGEDPKSSNETRRTKAGGAASVYTESTFGRLGTGRADSVAPRAPSAVGGAPSVAGGAPSVYSGSIFGKAEGVYPGRIFDKDDSVYPGSTFDEAERVAPGPGSVLGGGAGNISVYPDRAFGAFEDLQDVTREDDELNSSFGSGLTTPERRPMYIDEVLAEAAPAEANGGGEEEIEDDSDIPEAPLDRALYALSLQKPKEGEQSAAQRQRETRVSRIVHEILDGSTLTEETKDLELKITGAVQPEEGLRRVEQRVATLIARQLSIRSAAESAHDGEDEDVVLSVSVPKGPKGGPLKRKMTAGLKEKKLSLMEDKNNGRVFNVVIPRKRWEIFLFKEPSRHCAPMAPTTLPRFQWLRSLLLNCSMTRSFVSGDSMSIPATSVSGSPIAQPVTLDEFEMLSMVVADETANIPERASDRFYFEDKNVKFELDDGTLYNIHRYFFKMHAPIFTTYLRGALGEVIKLPNVLRVDFDRFLAFIYPSKLGRSDIQTVDEWTSVLRLATRWSIPTLCELAISEIEPKASPVDKIVIAREFDLGAAWIVPAFTAICQAPKSLDIEDAERLGMRTMIEVWRIMRGEKEVVVSDVLSAVSLEPSSASSDAGARPASDPASRPETPTPMFVEAKDGRASLLSFPQNHATEQLHALSGQGFTTALYSQLAKITDHLEYLTLRAAEDTKEAAIGATSVDHALHAVKLADRIAKETSPAAIRHREWRQEQVERICKSFPPNISTQLPYELQFSPPSISYVGCGVQQPDPFSEIYSRLAHLIVRQLRQGVQADSPEVSQAKNYLCVACDKDSTANWVKENLANPFIRVRQSARGAASNTSAVTGTRLPRGIGMYSTMHGWSRSRSPSVESFGSAESMSIPASPSTAESPVLPPAMSDEVVEPRVFSADDRELDVQHRFYLKDGNVKFELDDGKLYNVHRYFFDTHAPQFAAEHLRGRHSEHIKLHDVSSVDFERLLSIIYPTELGKCDIHTVDEWTSVLRLATKWSISSLRDLAIQEIAPKASAIDKVVIAREFNLGKAWLLPAFTEICDADKWVNYEDAQRLGLRAVVEIGRIRAEYSTKDLPVAVLESDVFYSDDHDGQPYSTHVAQTPPAATWTAPASRPTSAAASGLVEHAQASSPAAVTATSEACAEDKTASAVPGGGCPSGSGDSQLEKIGDHLEYLALRAAEDAEEDDICVTSIDRALYALKLADRIARETSPAALRHRGRRQRRLDTICKRFELSNMGNAAYTINIPPFSYAMDRIEQRIAQLLVIPIQKGSTGDVAETLVQRDWLRVLVHDAETRDDIKLDLMSFDLEELESRLYEPITISNPRKLVPPPGTMPYIRDAVLNTRKPCIRRGLYGAQQQMYTFFAPNNHAWPIRPARRSPVVWSTMIDELGMHEDNIFPERASSRFYLEDGNAKFELDDGTLYNIHRYFFNEHSPIFTKQHLHGARGKVIKLPDVLRVDFDRFLAFIYPTKLGRNDIQTVDDWTSVLRLAMRWSIPTLRDLAIAEIEPKASPVDKIVIAREFDLGATWIVPAFTAICQAPKWLNYEDAERLGMHTVVEVGRIMRGELDLAASDILRAASVPSTSDAGASPSTNPASRPETPTPTSTFSPTPMSCEAKGERTVPQDASGAQATEKLPALYGSGCTSAFDSQLTKINEHLEYLALRAMEDTKEAPVHITDVDRALYAVKLANCIATETSPAALRHREWRQKQVDRICNKFTLPSGLGEQTAYKLKLDASPNCVAEINTRIAELLVMQSLQSDVPKISEQRDRLSVTFAYGGTRDWVKRELEEQGLTVVNDDFDASMIHVLVPYPRFGRTTASQSVSD
ncbi:hypothetical protein BD626DRAFT_579628 [Schizophyllum amplum]|uniref:BTB domain-containing protein n=1 Tax=Schizophyllum amplum TaxID=97359 RepID=A0A550CVR8_9AGAR|nr:hypothetical protein BD626DRAFT_579628 [Auriculariopsis ampla]